MTESELPDIMNVDQCAAFLQVNRKTVYEMVKLGELPGAQNCRGVIRIRKKSMLAWLDAGAVPAPQRKRSK